MEFGFQPRVNEFEDKAKALLKQITERWVSMVKRDEAIYQSLMTVSTQFTKHEIFYMKYIQPVFLILSLACLVIVSVVFKRGKALKSVQILLLFSCTLEVCVILIIVPLDTILAVFADSDVPVPHPLCSIYLYVSLNVLDGILITALAIKIIFSINRLVSIQFPITAKIWLTPKNMARACLITTAVTVSIYVGLTYNNISVTHIDVHGDFWNTGRLSAYKACSVTENNVTQNVLLTLLYVVLLRVAPLLVLITCGVVLLVLLKRREREQRALNASNNKAYQLSRICSILIINFILLEIPQIMSVILYLYGRFGVATSSDTKYIPMLTAIIKMSSKITHGVNSNIALVLYALLSKKFRHDFQSLFCKCNGK